VSINVADRYTHAAREAGGEGKEACDERPGTSIEDVDERPTSGIRSGGENRIDRGSRQASAGRTGTGGSDGRNRAQGRAGGLVWARLGGRIARCGDDSTGRYDGAADGVLADAEAVIVRRTAGARAGAGNDQAICAAGDRGRDRGAAAGVGTLPGDD